MKSKIINNNESLKNSLLFPDAVKKKKKVLK